MREQGEYGVRCVRSAMGAGGYARAWAKDKDGRVIRYATEDEARAAAKAIQDRTHSMWLTYTAGRFEDGC